MTNDHRIEDLMARFQEGDGSAMKELLALTYDGLYDVARQVRRNERDGRARGTTSLLHEFIDRKLLPDPPTHFQNAAHFYNWASWIMRRLLIDDARRRVRQAGPAGSAIDRWPARPREDPQFDVMVSDLLETLAGQFARQAAVFSLRWFGRRSVRQTADLLSISDRSVESDYAYARAWLHRALTGGEGDARCPTG